MRWIVFATMALLPLASPYVAWGQVGLESIKRGKKATALVELNNAMGSAFCVDAEGLFLTSAHIVESASLGSKARLVLQGGEAGQKVLNAKILRIDKGRDLALLSVSGVNDFTPLELGKDGELIETMEVTTFGYPFGRQGTPASVRAEYPGVSVIKGRISSLPKVGGKLGKIMLDVTLNPGNSGGPVVDDTGKVIGVVQGGLRGAGINFAVPVSVVAEFVGTPTVEFEPPPLAFKDRHAPADWSVSMISVGPINPAPTVEISLGAPAGSPRVFEAKRVGPGRYSAKVVPISPPARVESRVIELTADFGAGQVRGRLKDRDLKIGEVPIKLGDLVLIEHLPKQQAITFDGRTLGGAVSGLGDASITLGDLEIALDLGKAAKIALQPTTSEPDTIACTAVVRSGGKELSRVDRIVKLQGAPASFSAMPSMDYKPAVFSGSKVVRKLPGRAADVVAGGNGRYLFLTLRDLKKLAVFDLASADVERFIPLAGDDALVAAGSEKLIIVYPETRIIQSYKIGTFKRTDSKSIPGEGLIRSIAMGSNSQGPLLFAKTYASGNNAAMSFGTIGFLDPNTLKPILDYHADGGRNMNMRQDISKGEMAFSELNMNWVAVFRASASGTSFGAWRTSVSPTGLISVVLQGKAVRYSYQHNSNGHVAPGPDGRILYTGLGGLFNEDLKPVQVGLASEDYYLPSTDPNYFLGIVDLPDPYGRNFPNQPKVEHRPRCKIFLAGTSTPLLDVGELEEMNFKNRANEQSKTGPALDRRIQFNPSAKLLVTIPESADQIFIRRVDVIESLQKSGVDYLFVTSIPPRTAFRRQTYSYPLTVASRRGGVTYSLSDGPTGMAISPEGKLSWDVPADFDGEDPTIVILVKDSSGQETFHTFSLRVR